MTPPARDLFSWVVLQIGRREHYSIPRLLEARHQLAALYTDIWCPGEVPSFLSVRSRQRLSSRFNSELSVASVHSPTLLEWFSNECLVALKTRLHGPWAGVICRNQWFQKRAVRWLDSQPWSKEPQILFAYSYAALLPFRWARKHGWHTILGQIDPGPAHFRVVSEVAQLHGLVPPLHPPESYWENWEKECQLAQSIMVNSDWSRECLLGLGIPDQKLTTVPLTYESKCEKRTGRPPIPDSFDAKRQLRVLYVGKLAAAKGLPELLAAAALTEDEPIEWLLAGPCEEAWVNAEIQRLPQVRWLGNQSGGAMAEIYEMADLLLLPSHSDGFALVQLEALFHGLPVIASRNCGRVVRSGVQGHVLPSVSTVEIVKIVRKILLSPAMLRCWTVNAKVPDEFQSLVIAERLGKLAEDLATI